MNFWKVVSEEQRKHSNMVDSRKKNELIETKTHIYDFKTFCPSI